MYYDITVARREAASFSLYLVMVQVLDRQGESLLSDECKVKGETVLVKVHTTIYINSFRWLDFHQQLVLGFLGSYQI